MIGIYALLFLAMSLVVKFCKGIIKILLAILIILITFYCVIFNIDRNRTFSNRLPMFALSSGLKEYEDKKTEIYKGLGYRIEVDKIEDDKLTIEYNSARTGYEEGSYEVERFARGPFTFTIINNDKFIDNDGNEYIR